MLYIAEKCNMCLAEVAVNWTEIEGYSCYFLLITIKLNVYKILINYKIL